MDTNTRRLGLCTTHIIALQVCLGQWWEVVSTVHDFLFKIRKVSKQPIIKNAQQVEFGPTALRGEYH